MPERMPVVAGRFYPAAPDELQAEVRSYLAAGKSYSATAPLDPSHTPPARLCGLMLPHAGYVFCGKVLGATLASPWNGSSAGAQSENRIIVSGNFFTVELIGSPPRRTWPPTYVRRSNTRGV